VKNLPVIVLFMLAVPCMAFGQAQPPKPGPEVQKLAYYVGTWKIEGEFATGKLSSTDACEWFTGGFYVVCRNEGTGTTGKRTNLRIIAYDAEAKAYTYYQITSSGRSTSAQGSLTGGTMTWLREGNAAGKPTKYRYTEVQVSPTAYTFKGERSVAGGPWTVYEAGKATKVE
jgi:hypothetical protein